MTNKILDEYIERLRASLSLLPADERDAVIAETRAHLEEAIGARMASEPGYELARVTLEETRGFGDPAEIAAARGAAPRDPPRAPFRWPRWAKIAAVVFALAVTTLVIVDIVDKPAMFTPYHRDNVLERHTAIVNETFTIPPDAETFYITIEIERVSGCAGVRITDPMGEVVLDQWDACGDLRRSVDVKPGVSGRTGAWRIEIQHRDFTGNVKVYSRGTLA